MEGGHTERRVGRLDRAKAELIDRAVAHARKTSRGGEALATGLLSLIPSYWSRVPAEDIVGREPVDIQGAAESQLGFAAGRTPGTALVRVISPTEEDAGWACPHSVVEIVTDDMPFLVDSVTAELNRQGYSIHLVVHPQLSVRRDAVGELLSIGDGEGAVAESWMHIEIDRRADVSEFAELRRDLRRVLEDVRAAVEDFERMTARVAEAIDELRATHRLPEDEVAETVALLEWMVDNFTFLGYREYELARSDGDIELRSTPGTGLGLLRDAGLEPQSRSFAELAPQARAKALAPTLLTLTQANSRSTVHRPAYLDYVGIKRFGDDSVPNGERRFLGLYGLRAYTVSVTTIPVIRRKVSEVLRRAGFAPDSHDSLDLIQILETYPRDELFAISVDDLYETAMGILGLQERRRVRLFIRRDDYGRFFSCLVYLPRDRYTTEVRMRIQSVFVEALGGTVSDYTTRLSESVLARLHFIIRTPDAASVDVDVDDLEARVAAAVRSWEDELADAVVDTFGEEAARGILQRYHDAFPEAYKEDFSARVAVADLKRLEGLAGEGDLDLFLYRPQGAPAGVRRFKISRVGPPLSLSDLMPKLQDMGVEVTDERPYSLTLGDRRAAWIYDFGLRHPADADFEAEGVRECFEGAFAAVWSGRMESDAFNALVLEAGLSWREVVVLRAYAAYIRQTGSTFSQAYVAQAVRNNVVIVRLLVDLFEARFNPQLADDRDAESASLISQCLDGLDGVASLDEDRILRLYLGLIQATLRTNHYQRGPEGDVKEYLALKLDPGEVPELPSPRPEFEIFVYSPRVEGVHLRFGPVARGGLRWSDRREDFRTEVLGLVKAQTVKNAVIVPTGAKGGFVVKQPGDEVVACYSLFVGALLDVTDNIVDGAVVPPADVVRHDDDDPYLVVAADKGTATFSDIANSIAVSRGFWLGDAFASGGSSGYDHKAMGITARGAWESVKRHFRELGVDIQSEDFTCVGIGDMSGDVFGNGMLLSQHTRLVAAFDHRHVFIDPDPVAATSYAERRRLFDLPRSSWDDYDRTLISRGGGVWPRSAKSVPISAEMRRALGIDVEVLTPTELIRAILRAPVDLLWNGGIGTYVKASTETNADVGDKANDAVRINGAELRVRVVGEGGNLGCTQRGRIEFAKAGGLIYTDAIDNSAGVDTSDHEVNIKILLDGVVASGDLTRKQRDELLVEMTDEVAALVLRDNYEHTIELGNSLAHAVSLLHVHARFMDSLVAAGQLDREVEFLPSSEDVAERMALGQGLTAPELAVLLAYRKITLTREVVASDLPDDPNFTRALTDYFPAPLRERYRGQMLGHRLRREIIATAVVNHMVNRAGITFVMRLVEETGSDAIDIVRAHNAGWRIFGMGKVWTAIERLDNVVSTEVQTGMFLATRQLVERASRWLLHNRPPPLDVAATVEDFMSGVEVVAGRVAGLLVGADAENFERRRDQLSSAGVPADLAVQVALLTPLYSALDIVAVGKSSGRPVEEVAEVYFAVEDRLGLHRLRDLVNALPRDDRWHTLARAALRDDLYAAHASLTGDILASTDGGKPAVERVTTWVDANAGTVQRAAAVLGEIVSNEHPDLATLSVALRQIRAVIRTSRAG